MPSRTVRIASSAAAGVVLVVLCLTAPVAATVLAFAVVVVALPTRLTIAGRLGPVIAVWLAVSQLGYLLTWPTGAPPRQAVGWTVAALVVLAWSAWRPAPLPRPGAAEVAVAAFVAAVAWASWPWRGDAIHVLDRMMLGWDNSGHFAMVEQLRLGLTTEQVGFPGYPRGYHATVASLIELVQGPTPAGDAELVAYLYASLVVIGAALVMLVAQVLSTPGLRTHPALLAPACAGLVTILLLLDDASQATYSGFGNFVVASALAGFAMLLPYRWTRRRDLSCWLLLGIAAAAILGTWTVMLAFLVPVPLTVLLGRRRERGLFRRFGLGVTAAAVPAVIAIAVQPSPAQAAQGAPGEPISLFSTIDNFLLLTGAIRTSSLGWPALFAVVAVAAPIAYGLLRIRQGLRTGVQGWTWLAPALALCMSVFILVYEEVRVGEVRYYGMKVLCASTIAAGSMGLAAGALVVRRLTARWRWRPVTRGAVSAAGALALLCCAGTPMPVGALPLSPGGTMRAFMAGLGPEQREPLARGVLASCALIAGHPGEYYLLRPATSREDLVRAGVWIITCGQNWASDQSGMLRVLLPDTREAGGERLIDLPSEAKHILSRRPHARLLVPTSDAAAAVSQLDFAERARVLTY